MTATADPLLVVESLAHPGGNITGLSSVTVDIESKRLGLLPELVPSSTRIAALYNMRSPTNPGQWQQIETAARSMGIQALLLDVRKPEDLGPTSRPPSSSELTASSWDKTVSYKRTENSSLTSPRTIGFQRSIDRWIGWRPVA